MSNDLFKRCDELEKAEKYVRQLKREISKNPNSKNIKELYKKLLDAEKLAEKAREKWWDTLHNDSNIKINIS